jgi:hypothetical protein
MNARTYRALFFFLLAVFFAIYAQNLVSARNSADEPKPQSAPDPLTEINDAFRTAYRHARIDLLAKVGPTVLVEGDNLILLRSGKRTEVNFTPKLYHDLKAISHIPLAIAMLLVPGSEEELTQGKLDALRRYREQVAAVNDILDKRFDGDMLKRQSVMTRACLGFLDETMKSRKATPVALVSFTCTFEWPINRNAADAARVQIDALHQQMTTWRGEMSSEEWKTLRVIVMGSQMPRRDNLAVQYFAKLLNEPGESSRIIYAEALWDEKKAIDLLGTRLLDTWIGSAFFGDERRMHRDLLGDAAREYLKQVDWK